MRITQSRPIIFLTVTAILILLIFAYIFTKPSISPINSEQKAQNEDIKPKLEMISYSLHPVGHDKVKLISGNYGFEILFSKEYEFSGTRGFNQYYPEHETVGMAVNEKGDTSDLTYSIDIGFLNEQSIEQIAKEEIENEKRSFRFAGKSDKIIVPIEKTQMNGTEGIRFQLRRASDDDVLVYYLTKGDKYYRISSGRNHGKHFTDVQLEEIRETFNSLRI